MQTYITLEKLVFFAYHGVNEQEKRVGNNYTIDLKLSVDFVKAMKSDHLADTISYADVYQVIYKEMQTPSNLLEHVGGRIVHRLFATYPAVEYIRIKLSKQNPPMGADVSAAAVEIECGREEVE